MAGIDQIVRAMGVDERLELDRQLQALQASPGWDRLQGLLSTQRDLKVRALTLRVHEHATYAHTAGSIAGMDLTAVIIDEVHQWADNDRRRLAERENRERDGD